MRVEMRAGETPTEPQALPPPGYPPAICLVAELPPPAGGMAVQAQRLGEHLSGEAHTVLHVPTNPLRPDAWLRKVPLLRGIVNLALYLALLLARVPRASVAHVFGLSHLSFFLFTAPAVLLARACGRRVVIHYHGGDAQAFLRRWGRVALPVLRLGHTLIVPSAFLVDVFAAFGLRATAVPNIMVLDQFRFRARTALQPTVLMARNLRPAYNVACGVRAFAQLAAQHPGARLTIAGDGPERAALQRQCAELGLAAQVQFVGNVDNDRMSELFNRHDILLNTSRVDNQPVSLLEAFACGLAVVSTSVGGIPQMAEHGRDALLAPDNDDAALARHLLRLLDEPGLGAELARHAHQRVQQCDWTHVYPLLAHAYGAPHPGVAV